MKLKKKVLRFDELNIEVENAISKVTQLNYRNYFLSSVVFEVSIVSNFGFGLSPDGKKYVRKLKTLKTDRCLQIASRWGF